MVGFTAFKIWIAVTQHFNPSSKYDIKKHKAPRCKYETYLSRKDYFQFERIATKYSEKEWLQYLIANTLYGNTGCVFDLDSGEQNRLYYISRRESAIYLMGEDLKRLLPYKKNYLKMISALTKSCVAIESIIALNRFVPLVETIRKETDIPVIEPLLSRIERGDTFVKVPPQIEQFIKENFLE